MPVSNLLVSLYLDTISLLGTERKKNLKCHFFQRGNIFFVVHLDADEPRGDATHRFHHMDDAGKMDEHEQERSEKLDFLP